MGRDSKNSLRHLVGYQAAFWTILFGFGLAQVYSNTSDTKLEEIIYYNLCHLLFQIISANVIYYYFVVHFFDLKRYGLFSISVLVSLYGLSAINRIFVVYVAEPFFINEPKDSLILILTDLSYLATHYTFPILTASFIFICFMHILRYNLEKQDRIQLQKDKAELELKVLKFHLNPHFLFNTLNNIYSLSLNRPDKTPESIAGLADLLDYVLDKGSQKMVRITDEINAINRYIELEGLRYGNSLEISRTAQLQAENRIPPLLYLSLVENAFKHGSGSMDRNLSISIDLQTDAVKSVFSVRNSCFRKESNGKRGTGLVNIEEQLKLYYQTNFELSVHRGEGWFSVQIITPADYD